MVAIPIIFSLLKIAEDLENHFMSRRDSALNNVGCIAGGLFKMTTAVEGCFKRYVRDAVCRLKDTLSYIPLSDLYFYHFVRPNFSKNGKTPLQIILEDHPRINSRVLNLPVYDLDTLFRQKWSFFQLKVGIKCTKIARHYAIVSVCVSKKNMVMAIRRHDHRSKG